MQALDNALKVCRYIFSPAYRSELSLDSAEHVQLVNLQNATNVKIVHANLDSPPSSFEGRGLLTRECITAQCEGGPLKLIRDTSLLNGLLVYQIKVLQGDPILSTFDQCLLDREFGKLIGRAN